MKKVSVVRANVKPLPAKNLNMKHCHGDQDKNKEICFTDSECVVESQAQYIENLQQQIFVLENEVGYLRTYLHESNKQHPSMVAESEKMVKKLAECHNEMRSLKVELKRKQTTVDMLRSERDRVLRYKEELEEKFRKEKCKLLEELITSRKAKESLQERNTEVEQLLKDQKQNERNYQEDIDNLKITIEQSKREKIHDKEFIDDLMRKKELLQKDLLEMKMIEKAKPENGVETVRILKGNISELQEVSEANRAAVEHERMLRERLAEDNAKLIKRLADLESELAETKARFREEECKRVSLEEVHLGTVLEASEAKSRDENLREEIGQLTRQLREETEKALALGIQLAEERRFKGREEERLTQMSERLEQKEEQMRVREEENIELMRDNTYLKDQVLHLKEQVRSRDEEVCHLKQKVGEMQVSVEEFVQSTQAANRLAGERWKQLGQLAHGITALTTAIEPHTADDHP